MEFFKDLTDDEEQETNTSLAIDEQESYILVNKMLPLQLLREPHISFVQSQVDGYSSIGHLPTHCWFPIYHLGAAYLLQCDPQTEKCLHFLKRLQRPDGGFASCPRDNINLVYLYGAINGVIAIGTEEAYELVDKQKIRDEIMKLKKPDGSFDAALGELGDPRSTYSAIVIADLLGILDDELTTGVAEYILSCQTYDGGFAAVPGGESHGGFGFCAIGTLKILKRLDECNLNRAIQWIVTKQSQFSGGFIGRTNKLPDSCYTWWIGSMARQISDHLKIPPFWNQEGLVNYVYGSCQHHRGGLRDHLPNTRVDQFHTMYSLAGLSVAGPDLGLPECDTMWVASPDLVQKARDYFHSH